MYLLSQYTLIEHTSPIVLIALIIVMLLWNGLTSMILPPPGLYQLMAFATRIFGCLFFLSPWHQEFVAIHLKPWLDLNYI